MGQDTFTATEVNNAGESKTFIVGIDDFLIKSKKKNSNIIKFLKKVFLPRGYPKTVSGDYLEYQKWDTAQAFCSTIAGIIVTQEVLRAVGVGDQNASVLAATFLWVFKEACGHLGRIIFSFTQGENLDANSKSWRLQADILNDIAMSIEIMLPYLSHSIATYCALCVSTTLKAVVGIAGGATRVALTQHHAINGNIGDVSAKDSVQETAVNLTASVISLLLLKYCPESGLKLIFLIMVVLHIAFNYLAVKAVCLHTFNETRWLMVLESYYLKNLAPTPREINNKEAITIFSFGGYRSDFLCGYTIIQGVSIMDTPARRMNPFELKHLRATYKDFRYLIIPDEKNKTIYVVLKATEKENLLLSYYHALVTALCTHVVDSYESTSIQVANALGYLYTELNESASNNFKYNRINPVLINIYVKSAWAELSTNLQKAGWDTEKSLLVPQQWRITSKKRN